MKQAGTCTASTRAQCRTESDLDTSAVPCLGSSSYRECMHGCVWGKELSMVCSMPVNMLRHGNWEATRLYTFLGDVLQETSCPLVSKRMALVL
jgi:hypothetical protein